MRIALLSDIHGNPLALDAVLDDIRARGGADVHWVLGDFAALGYDPVGALERAAALPNPRYLRGNTDRYVTAGDRPPPTPDDVRRDPDLLAQYAQVAQSFAWTQGAVTATGWFDWLAALPVEQRLTLPDGTSLLAVHAAPGTDDGPGIHPRLGDDELAALLAPAEADLVFVAHTHVPLDRTAGQGAGVRVVNLGSVSNPLTEDLRASYVLLEADESGYRVERRQVEYDREAVIAAIERAHHPAEPYLVRFMRGENRSPWL
jgi:predicted phosphodiesterase